MSPQKKKRERKKKSQKLETDEEIDANVGPDTGEEKNKKITSNAKGEALALLACKCQECINETKTMKRGKKEDETPADGEGISLFSPEKKKNRQL